MKTILIVDDEKTMCSLFSKMFSKDCEVLSAYSGKEAVGLFRKRKPLLVITDYHMAGIDGIETIKRIKKISSECRFILVFSGIGTRELKKAEKLGVDYIISKPFNLGELKKTIKKALKK